MKRPEDGLGLRRQVMIVGGGASGLVAAVAAARAGASVTVLEHMDRVGKKILSTGNGRCNMTNLALDEGCYRCSQEGFPMQVIDGFGVWDTLSFFDELGIVTKSKNGYIYPNSEQASAVLDTLRLEVEHLGVRVVTGCHIARLEKEKNGQKKRKRFLLETDQGNFRADAVILATGSKAAPVTGSDGSGYELAKGFGHRVIEPLPALVQLRCDGRFFKQLAGIRCEAAVTLRADGQVLAQDEGEVQLTDYGVSGIPTFQVSRFASVALKDKRYVTVELDFLPSKSMEDARQFLSQRVERMAYRNAGDLLTGVVQKKLALVLLKRSGIGAEQPVKTVEAECWDRLLGQMKRFEAVVTSTNSFEQAQVCCGGVDTREVDPRTLESRKMKNLYLVGELLDVDGICGGYNLQWAWSTGMIAGACAGRMEA